MLFARAALAVALSLCCASVHRSSVLLRWVLRLRLRRLQGRLLCAICWEACSGVIVEVLCLFANRVDRAIAAVSNIEFRSGAHATALYSYSGATSCSSRNRFYLHFAASWRLKIASFFWAVLGPWTTLLIQNRYWQWRFGYCCSS